MIEFFTKDSELLAAIVGGIIATIGSVAITITAYLLRRSGKISINVSSLEFSFTKPDGFGGSLGFVSSSDADKLTFRLGLDLYNSSDVPRSLRDIYLVIRMKSKKEFLFPLFIPNPNSQSPFFRSKKLEIINLPPKELIHLDVHGSGSKEEIVGLNGNVDVYFKAAYPTGKKFSALILKTELKS